MNTRFPIHNDHDVRNRRSHNSLAIPSQPQSDSLWPGCSFAILQTPTYNSEGATPPKQ
jgi:hypothetical protein